MSTYRRTRLGFFGECQVALTRRRSVRPAAAKSPLFAQSTRPQTSVALESVRLCGGRRGPPHNNRRQGRPRSTVVDSDAYNCGGRCGPPHGENATVARRKTSRTEKAAVNPDCHIVSARWHFHVGTNKAQTCPPILGHSHARALRCVGYWDHISQLRFQHSPWNPCG